eukprot:scaffold1419_cov410-Prasinococcus_capsulatus_cf.AAC.12
MNRTGQRFRYPVSTADSTGCVALAAVSEQLIPATMWAHTIKLSANITSGSSFCIRDTRPFCSRLRHTGSIP